MDKNIQNQSDLKSMGYRASLGEVLWTTAFRFFERGDLVIKGMCRMDLVGGAAGFEPLSN